MLATLYSNALENMPSGEVQELHVRAVEAAAIKVLDSASYEEFKDTIEWVSEDYIRRLQVQHEGEVQAERDLYEMDTPMQEIPSRWQDVPAAGPSTFMPEF